MNGGTRRRRFTLRALLLAGLLLPGLGALRPPPAREAQALWGGDAGQASRSHLPGAPPVAPGKWGRWA